MPATRLEAAFSMVSLIMPSVSTWFTPRARPMMRATGTRLEAPASEGVHHLRLAHAVLARAADEHHEDGQGHELGGHLREPPAEVHDAR